MKIGVIGVGHLGSIHTRLWNENEDAELYGIYDIDKTKADSYAEAQGCKSFASLDEAVEECDAVTIATVTTDHYDTAIRFLEKGKHTLIEKPITASYEQAQRLIEAAKKSGSVIRVGHVERFNPAIASLSKEEINPLFIEAHRLSQFRPRATDVSVIHDLMIHDIDIVLWMAGSKVKNLSANGVAVLTDTIDICNARLEFESGLVANLTSSRISANPMRKMRLFQKDAYYSIDFGKPEVEVYNIKDGQDGDSENLALNLGSIDLGTTKRSIFYSKPELPTLNAIQEEQKGFLEAIKGGDSIGADAESAAEALRVAEEISEITSKNMPVK
ncbi:MAG: Gfo/Idh/MocA family oxidoreductase [Candidatus Kapaibacteriales bacterium]